MNVKIMRTKLLSKLLGLDKLIHPSYVYLPTVDKRFVVKDNVSVVESYSSKDSLNAMDASNFRLFSLIDSGVDVQHRPVSMLFPGYFRCFF